MTSTSDLYNIEYDSEIGEYVGRSPISGREHFGQTHDDVLQRIMEADEYFLRHQRRQR
jgi:hypothetical protein